MTVKCLNEIDKQDIAIFYKEKVPVKDIAFMYGYSERTIRRVLEEYELVPVSRVKPASIPTKPNWRYAFVRYVRSLFSNAQPHV